MCFPMLDNGYVYLAATRVSLHRAEGELHEVSSKRLKSLTTQQIHIIGPTIQVFIFCAVDFGAISEFVAMPIAVT